LRAVDGERDNFAGGTQAGGQSSLQKVTGADLRRGLVLLCFGSQNSVDSNWNTGAASWAKDRNLQWPTNFTTK
jgi:hypothetical protein